MLQPLIAARLSEEHSCLFAQPLSDPKTGEVFWCARVAGEAIAYADLAPEDRAAVDVRLNKLLFDLLEFARKMPAQTKSLEEFVAGQLLQIQLDAAYTEKECLYMVGYQPVIAFWAFESGYAPNQFVPSPKVAPAEITSPPPIDEDDLRVVAPESTEWMPPSAEAESKSEAAAPTKRPREPWSFRTFGVLAIALAVAFFGIFGLSPRATLIDWLDRVQTLRAREQALLRLIARSERARTEGVSEAELHAEMAALSLPASPQPPELQDDMADEGFDEPAEEPLPPFESSKGALAMGTLPAAVVILHFWHAAGEKSCAEITSFVSMVGGKSFEALRQQGGEAYLVTTEESVEKGNELLRACVVQDPLLLRDPEGQILGRLSPGAKPPTTVVFDKDDERTLGTYSRRSWTDAKAFEELRQIFLMRVF